MLVSRLVLSLALLIGPAAADVAVAGPRVDPDAEVPYIPPRRVIAPPVYTQPGPVIFPKAPLLDGSFCSPPYDFCEPYPYDEWW